MTEHVQKIRAERDAHFKEEFGDRGNELAIEREIDRENAEIRREEHKALMANLDKNKAPEQPDIKT